MKSFKYFFLALLLLFVFSKSDAQFGSAPRNEFYVTPFNQIDLEIDLYLVIEDQAQGFYSLAWEVTKSSPRKLGPMAELHCFVWEGDSLIEEYSGLSTPMTYCSFQSNSKKVKVIFEVRNKLFPEPVKSPERRVTIPLQPVQSPHLLYIEACDKSEYRPISLTLRKTMAMRKTLVNNDRIVQLDYVNKGAMIPDEMPHLGCNYQMVLCLDRYYINLKTGRILPGRRWLARKSVRNILRKTELVLLHPSISYTTNANLKISGHRLVKKARLKMEDFDLNQFYSSYMKAPY
ncbi:MAG: hypothetical protein ACJAU0_002091 [Flavobacteriales bacterium]|jgi:hypothetical protein